MAAGHSNKGRPSWIGLAFVVEAILLLVFLIGAMALFTNLFASSVKRCDESQALTVAVAVASDTAERFAANPDSVPQSAIASDMVVTCDVADDKREDGVFRVATITVYDPDEQPVYTLTTAVYESGAQR